MHTFTRIISSSFLFPHFGTLSALLPVFQTQPTCQTGTHFLSVSHTLTHTRLHTPKCTWMQHTRTIPRRLVCPRGEPVVWMNWSWKQLNNLCPVNRAGQQFVQQEIAKERLFTGRPFRVLFWVYSGKLPLIKHYRSPTARGRLPSFCGAHLECPLLSDRVQYTFNKLITLCWLGYFISLEKIFLSNIWIFLQFDNRFFGFIVYRHRSKSLRSWTHIGSLWRCSDDSDIQCRTELEESVGKGSLWPCFRQLITA